MRVIEQRDKALRLLKGKVDDFALGGGTALSAFYFHHRESYDLDFFTKDFSEKRIAEVIEALSEDTGEAIKLKERITAPNQARVIRYQVAGGLWVDFIEDVFREFHIKNAVNGIPVLSKESIYLRKLYAMCGVAGERSDTGRKISVGGRQEAKDYFDVYILSTAFMPLSKFVENTCDLSEIERVVIWYRRYDRLNMTNGLLELNTSQTPDIKVINRHFDQQIKKIIDSELG
ncbi:MAG: nucleotidyl transferase AbiEii/AbiGii toxin family protein [Candidatus Omnitrophica bacterium]|nr:nucleotidyl transferase AbiEii/AbiGii toxin family protein [Candidatus Omnitrophota bacterium]